MILFTDYIPNNHIKYTFGWYMIASIYIPIFVNILIIIYTASSTLKLYSIKGINIIKSILNGPKKKI